MYQLFIVVLLAITLEVTGNANPEIQSRDLEIEKLRIKLQVYEELLNSSFTCNCNVPTKERKCEEEEQDQVPNEINENMIRELIEEAFYKLPVNEKLNHSMQHQFHHIHHQINQLKKTDAAQQTQLNSNVDTITGLEQTITSLQVNQKTDGVAFSVYLTGGEYNGIDEPIPFTGVYTNIGGHFNTNTHKFMCPVDGVYTFMYSIYSGYIQGSKNSGASLYLNGILQTSVFSDEEDPDHDSKHQAATAIILECRAQQQVWLQNHWTDNKIYSTDDGRYTVFSGYLLHTL